MRIIYIHSSKLIHTGALKSHHTINYVLQCIKFIASTVWISPDTNLSMDIKRFSFSFPSSFFFLIGYTITVFCRDQIESHEKEKGGKKGCR